MPVGIQYSKYLPIVLFEQHCVEETLKWNIEMCVEHSGSVGRALECGSKG